MYLRLVLQIWFEFCIGLVFNLRNNSCCSSTLSDTSQHSIQEKKEGLSFKLFIQLELLSNPLFCSLEMHLCKNIDRRLKRINEYEFWWFRNSKEFDSTAWNLNQGYDFLLFLLTKVSFIRTGSPYRRCKIIFVQLVMFYALSFHFFTLFVIRYCFSLAVRK